MSALKGRCGHFEKFYAATSIPRPFRAQPGMNDYLGFTPQATLCRRFAALTSQETCKENWDSVKLLSLMAMGSPRRSLEKFAMNGFVTRDL